MNPAGTNNVSATITGKMAEDWETQKMMDEIEKMPYSELLHLRDWVALMMAVHEEDFGDEQ